MYLNYDSYTDRTKIIKSDWNRTKELMILDEIHKKKLDSYSRRTIYYFFYDNGQVVGDEGARFENLVAATLLKELHSLEDLKEKNTAFNYLKTKEGKEVDFLVTIDRRPCLMMEVKWGNGNISPNLFYFKDYFREKK